MPERFATTIQPLAGPRKASLDQRIEELRARQPIDLNHGEALMLQGIASASLREQRITSDRLNWD